MLRALPCGGNRFVIQLNCIFLPTKCITLAQGCKFVHRVSKAIIFFCRISQMFEIIVDFPDSEPAIKDLIRCLQHVDLKKRLICFLEKRYV